MLGFFAVAILMVSGWCFIEGFIWIFKNIQIKIREDENTK